MSASLVILAALMVPAFVWLWRNTPSTASFVSGGDSDRDRRFAHIEPYHDGEILPVIKDRP